MKTFLPPPRCKMLETIRVMNVNQKPIQIAKADLFSSYRAAHKLAYRIVTRAFGKHKFKVWRIR